MKKTFTKEYMVENCGCYGAKKTMQLFFSSGNESITISDILNADIPLKDKYWFVCRKTNLPRAVNQQTAIDLAELVLPIYEKIYPNNSTARKCIEAAKQFLAGHISVYSLIKKSRATNAYYAASNAAYYAAYTAVHADADAAAYYASNAAYAAYYAADTDIIKKQIEQYLVDLVNNQPED